MEHTKRDYEDGSVTSPVMANFAPMAENLVKRSNTFVSLVSKAINANSSSEPTHIRLRADAEAADKEYRVGVRRLDRQRLGLEERIEETLKAAQRWELERLQAVKTVLLQYHGTLSNLPALLQPALAREATLVASFQPESDIRALIERYRTGPFKPTAHVYESITHDEADVYFGIDLRKWAEGSWFDIKGTEGVKDKIPEVLTALLAALNDAYPKLPNDAGESSDLAIIINLFLIIAPQRKERRGSTKSLSLLFTTFAKLSTASLLGSQFRKTHSLNTMRLSLQAR